MKRKILFATLGLALLVLAVGGWIVQGFRFAPRALVVRTGGRGRAATSLPASA